MSRNSNPDPNRPRMAVWDSVEATQLSAYSLDVEQNVNTGRYVLTITNLQTGQKFVVSDHDTIGNAVQAGKDYKFPSEKRWDAMVEEAHRQEEERKAEREGRS